MSGNARRVAVLGAGAWGTALAAAARRAGHAVTLWARDDDLVDAVTRTNSNPSYLPGIALPTGITATTSIVDALQEAALVLVVVPMAATAAVLERAASAWPADAIIFACAKGLASSSEGREMLPLDLARRSLAAAANPDRMGVLSGPSFAVDVARGLPTAVSLALPDRERAADAARLLSTPEFRCYATDDVAGVQLGGAVKNVVAIAAGIAAGRGFGASAHAAIVARGHREMMRLAIVRGAREVTLSGLSGLGDLILTAASEQSRNYRHGLALGRGETPPAATVEGVRTTAVAHRLAKSTGIRAPIIAALDSILHDGAEIDDTIRALLARAPGMEDE